MGASKPLPQLREFLAGYDSAIRALALRLRAIVVDEMAPCHEYIFWMRSKVVLMYGASDRVIDDNVCSISVFARHVDLAFKRGADLADPDAVLEGTGIGMRHIKIRTPADVERPPIRRLLRTARRQAGLKPAPRAGVRRVTTRVKPKPGETSAHLPKLF